MKPEEVVLGAKYYVAKLIYPPDGRPYVFLWEYTVVQKGKRGVKLLSKSKSSLKITYPTGLYSNDHSFFLSMQPTPEKALDYMETRTKEDLYQAQQRLERETKNASELLNLINEARTMLNMHECFKKTHNKKR